MVASYRLDKSLLKTAATRVAAVVRSGWVTQGEQVEQLEKRWCGLTKRREAVAVSSGQHALEIALAYYTRKDAPVGVQGNGFVGDPMAVLRTGGMVKVLDCGEDMQLDIHDCRLAFCQGVVVTHIGGWACGRMQELEEWARKRGAFLIEDCAQAHGVMVGKRPVGSFGDASIFSFYATKLVTCGEGGMLVTDDLSLAEYARLVRNNGSESVFRGEAQQVAGDCRLSDVLAVMALVFSERLPELIGERWETAAYYDYQVMGAEDFWPLKVAGVVPNWYKYILRTRTPEVAVRVTEALRSEGVEVGSPVYDRPALEHVAFKGNRRVDGKSDTAKRMCASHVCVPIYNGMTVGEIAKVGKALRGAK